MKRALPLLLLTGCQIAGVDPDASYLCEPDGGCSPGFVCSARKRCEPYVDAGVVDAGPLPAALCDAGCRGLTVCGGGGNPERCALNTRFCNSAGWCWENPLPQGNDLFAMWSGDAGILWAVGASGTIIGRTQGQWFLAPSPTGETLYAVHGASPSNVWAVGTNGVVLRFDGGEWFEVARDTARDVPLYGVFASEDGGAWMVGGGGKPMAPGRLFRWDGAALESVPLPMSPLGALKAISGPHGADLTVVGVEGGSYHFDGASWVHRVEPSAGAWYALTGNAAGDLYVAGEPGLYRREGDGGWSEVNDSLFSLTAVHLTPGGELLFPENFQGISRIAGSGSDAGRVVELDQPSNAQVDRFLGFAEDSSGVTWAVGSGGRIASRRANGTWDSPDDDRYSTLRSVWSADGDHAVAVGDQTITSRLGPRSWSRPANMLDTRHLGDMRAVTGIGRDEYLIAGASSSAGTPSLLGVISGSRYSWYSPTVSGVSGAAYLPDGRIYVTSLDGVSVQDRRDAGFRSILSDAGIAAVAADDTGVFLAGAAGLAWSGPGDGTWNPQFFGNFNFFSVWWGGSSAGAWRCGMSGALYHDNVAFNLGVTSSPLNAVHAGDPNHLWAVSAGGLVFHVQPPSSFSIEQTGTDRQLYGVFVTDGGVIYAVGEHETILRKGLSRP